MTSVRTVTLEELSWRLSVSSPAHADRLGAGPGDDRVGPLPLGGQAVRLEADVGDDRQRIVASIVTSAFGHRLLGLAHGLAGAALPDVAPLEDLGCVRRHGLGLGDDKGETHRRP